MLILSLFYKFRAPVTTILHAHFYSMTKTLRYLLFILLCTGICLPHGRAQVPKSAGGKPASWQSIATPDRESFVRSATQWSLKYKSLEGPEGQRAIDSLWGQLSEDGQDMASMAALLSLLGRNNAAVAIAARAGATWPDDTLAANNLGAALHTMDAYTEALQAFLYARRLCPQSPIILTNMAALAIDMNEMGTAMDLLKEATGLAPEHCNAWTLMAAIYIKQNKPVDAAKAILRTGACGFSAVKKKQLEKPPADRDDPPKPVWVSGGGHRAAAPEPGSLVPSGLPWIPDLPLPASAQAFLSSHESREKWLAYFKNIHADASQGLKESYNKEAVEALVKRKTEYASRKKTPFKLWIKEDDRYALMFERTDLYYNAQQRKLWERFTKEARPIDELLSRTLSDISALEQEKTDRLAGDPVALQIALAPYCKQRKEAIENAYALWRKAFIAAYREACDLLGDYYEDTDAIIAKVRHPSDRHAMDLQRKQMVYLTLYPVPFGNFAIRPMLYVFGKVTVGVKGDCSVPEPPMPYRLSADALPGASKGKCPFNPPLKAKVAGLSVKVDCSALEVETGEALVASYKYNYTNREHTYFIGLGISTGLELPGIKHDVSLKGGIYLTTQGGEITDYGLKGSLSKSKTFGGGPAEIGTENETESAISFMDKPKVAMETGPKLSFYNP